MPLKVRDGSGKVVTPLGHPFTDDTTPGSQWRVVPATIPGAGGQPSKSADLILDDFGVLLYRESGYLDRVLTDARSSRAVWDGRDFWVCIQRGVNSSVVVLDIDGKVKAQIGAAQGLPPTVYSMALHALGSGRVLVAGAAMGNKGGGWLSVIEAAAGDAISPP